MHEVSIKKKEADTNRLRQEEEKRSNKAKEKINIGQWDDKKFLETMNIIFGKGGVLGAAANALNDPRWYISSPSIANDAASFPAYQRNAEVFNYSIGKKVVGSDVLLGRVASAIYRFNLALTLGCKSNAQDSGINVAARILYNKIRQANSSASAYDPGELMKIIYCVLTAYILLTSGVRMLRFAKSMNEFDPNINYKVPTYFDMQDMVSNRANWKTYINYVIKQLDAFPIPANLPVFQREIWLAGTALMDAAHKNRSIYFAEFRYLYSWDDANDVAQCIDVSANSPMNLYQFQFLMKTLIDNLTNSSIAVTVYRDIVQAASKGLITVFKYPEITEAQFDAPMEFIYNPEVLNQFHNATIMGELETLSELNIEDNSSDGVTHNDPTPEFFGLTDSGNHFDVSISANYGHPALPLTKNYLSVLDDDTSADRILVATRFTVSYNWVFPTTGPITVEALDFGTEIVCSVSVGYTDRSGGATVLDIDSSVVAVDIKGTSFLSSLATVCEASNYLPFVYVIAGNSDAAKNDSLYFYRDERVVQLDDQALTKLHTLAQQGLFEYR